MIIRNLQFYSTLLAFTLLATSDKGAKAKDHARLVENAMNATSENEILLTAKAYAKIFKERRNEQHFMAKQMLKSNYEKNYKLLKLAYTKIFEVLHNSNETLTAHSYNPTSDGFPQTDIRLQTAVMLSLENCCIASESLLHFPEVSYRILRQLQIAHANWKSILNWCIDFVNALPHITNESTVKLMELLQQEINEEQRKPDYENPYYAQTSKAATANRVKKPPKKLKKGPQLSGGKNEL